jgi:hypothetical protein
MNDTFPEMPHDQEYRAQSAKVNPILNATGLHEGLGR